MEPLDIMKKHLNKLGKMANELNVIEAIVLNEVKVLVLFMSLSNNYQSLTTSQQFSNMKDYRWEDVSTKLF
jgi:hypothetical protein